MRNWIFRLRASVQDLSAEEIALLLVIGCVLGVFPIMGCPTILCLLAALRLRLNVAALQLVNNVTSPLQLALLLPLERAGRWLCGGYEWHAATVAARFAQAALHAVAGWTCICVPTGLLVYVGIWFALRSRKSTCCHRSESPA